MTYYNTDLTTAHREIIIREIEEMEEEIVDGERYYDQMDILGNCHDLVHDFLCEVHSDRVGFNPHYHPREEEILLAMAKITPLARMMKQEGIIQ